MDAIGTVKSGFGSVKASVGQLASLNLDTMEKVAAKQIESMNYYADLGFEQIKGVKKIGSFSDAKAYSSKTLDSGGAALKKLIADGKEYVGMGKTYKDEVVSIAKSLKPKKA